MLYPRWQPLPRPRHFTEDPKLDRLLDSYFDPGIGYFKLRLWRCGKPAICGKGCLARKGFATCRRARAC